MSQLDFALAADVSARHISFLETGRAKPSREMILRLAATLAVPLRQQNDLLVAAGFEPAFAESETLPPVIERALDYMLQAQTLFPVTILNHRYDVIRSNGAARALLQRFVAEPSALPPVANVFDLVFDPRLIRPFLGDWKETARAMLARLQREMLNHGSDAPLAALHERVFSFPGVREVWQSIDLTRASQPVLPIHLQRDDWDLRFLSTLTVFNAPQNVALDELRIESYFPLDAATEKHCAELTRAS